MVESLDFVNLSDTEELEVPSSGEQFEVSPRYADFLSAQTAVAFSDPLSSSTAEERLAQFRSDKEQAQAYATPLGETEIRMMAANLRTQRSTEALQGVTAEIAGGSDIDILREATDDLFYLQDAAADKFALEKETLDRLEDYGLLDSDGIQVAEEMASGETALDDLRDKVERSLILQNAFDVVAAEHEDEGTALTIFNYLAMIMPWNKAASLSSIFHEGEFLTDPSGTQLREVENNIYHADLSPIELKVAVDNWVSELRDHSGLISQNTPKMMHILSQMKSIGTKEASFENAIDWLDVAAFTPIVGMTRLSKAGLANISRAKEMSRAVTLDGHVQARAGQVVEDIDDVIDQSMPDAARANPTDTDKTVGVSDDVNRVLAEQERMGEEINHVLNETASARTTLEEDVLIKEAEQQMAARHEGSFLKNFQAISEKGILKVSALLGTKTGGFARLQDAKAAITRMGLKNQGIHIDPDGRHYIRVNYDVKDGAHMQMGEVKSGPSWLRWLTRGKLGSSNSFIDPIMQGRAAQANLLESTMHRTVNRIIKEGWKPLRKDERGRVQDVLLRGNQEGKWYKPDEFVKHFQDMHNGRMPNQREYLGYYSAKNLSDFDWQLRNNVQYKELVRDGWEFGEFRMGDMNYTGNVKTRDIAPTNFRGSFYDPETKTHYSQREIASDDLTKMMKDKGKVLVEMSEHLNIEGLPTNMILLDSATLLKSPLKFNQIKYSGGGHRIYDGDFWVKQVRKGKYKGSDRNYVLSPLTHIVAKTRGQAAEWAARMDRVRVAHNEKMRGSIDEAAFQKIASDNAVDMKDWEKWVADGEVDLNNPFEVVTSEMNVPTGHTKALTEDGIVDMSQVRSPQASYLQDNGRLYYSRKGSVKKGPQDEVAELIDPMQSVNRGVENAIRLAAYSEYKMRAINSWVNKYGHIIPGGKGLTGAQKFFDDVDITKLNIDPDLKWAAHNSRQAMQRQLSQGSDYMRGWKSTARSLGGWFEGKGAPGVAGRIYDAGSRDPVTALKGMSFDLKLGLFDPSQLIIQTQTMASMAFLDPINAGRFAWDGMMLRRLAHNSTDEFLNWAAKRSNLDVDEFKAMSKAMNETGAANVGGELILLDRHATAMKRGPINTIRDMGRLPFYEAERLNRVFAFRKSWHDLRKKNDLDWMDTPDGRAELSRLTDKYTNNMLSASAAAWQKGLMSVPTQFLSYQARLMENILPAMFGGNRQFSSGEKMKLFMSQVVLYGAAGVPAGEYVLRKLTEAGVIDIEETGETAYRAISGGFWDSMLYAATGGELDLAPSQRLAPAQGIETFVMDLFGANEFEDMSLFTYLSGAPGSVAGDVTSDAIDVLKDVWLAAQSEKVDLIDVAPDMLQTMAENASSYSRWHKAFMVMKYGDLISQNTGRTITKATSMEAFAALMGITPRDTVNMEWMNALTNERQGEIKKIRRRLSEHRQAYWRAFRDDDRDAMEQQLRIINGTLGLYPPEVRQRVLKGMVNNKDLRPLIDTVTEKFNKRFKPNLFPQSNTEN